MIVLDVMTWGFLIAGSFFSIVGGIGIVRLPELEHEALVDPQSCLGPQLVGLVWAF